MNETPLRSDFGVDVAEPGGPDNAREVAGWEAEPSEAAPAQSGMRVRSMVRELVETALFILLVFFIVRGIVQNFKIEGSSMEPTLHSGQYILVNKLVYFHFDLNAPLRLLPGQEELPQRIIYPFHQPHHGDIVVFEYPKDISKDYIKRVIGLPGEQVEIRDGKVFVNGKPINQAFLPDPSTFCSSGYACYNGPVTIPEGNIFVLGDNRNNSSDSREWGVLPLDRVVGQAWVIYYPISDWGLVPHYEFSNPSVVGSLPQ